MGLNGPECTSARLRLEEVEPHIADRFRYELHNQSFPVSATTEELLPDPMAATPGVQVEDPAAESQT